MLTRKANVEGFSESSFEHRLDGHLVRILDQAGGQMTALATFAMRSSCMAASTDGSSG